MEINKLVALCNRYSSVQNRIKRLEHVLGNIEKDIRKISNGAPEHLIINGLKWDTNNLSVGGTEINGNHYYTFDEAQEAAKSVGKRCPTTQEFEELVALGSTCDNKKKGIWVAGNHSTDHTGSLFFPAAGLRDYNTGVSAISPENGYYWSSSTNSSTSAFAGSLYFNSSGGVSFQGSNHRAYGFSVRCVSDNYS